MYGDNLAVVVKPKTAAVRSDQFACFWRMNTPENSLCRLTCLLLVKCRSWIHHCTARHKNPRWWDYIRCCGARAPDRLRPFVFSNTRDKVLALIVDNLAKKKAIETTMNIGFIGCTSHHFNFAVVYIISWNREMVDEARAIMKKLRHIIPVAHLGKLSRLLPALNNVTRWSSRFYMLTKYTAWRSFFYKSCWLSKMHSWWRAAPKSHASTICSTCWKRSTLWQKGSKQCEKSGRCAGFARQCNWPLSPNRQRLAFNANIVHHTDFNAAW